MMITSILVILSGVTYGIGVWLSVPAVTGLVTILAGIYCWSVIRDLRVGTLRLEQCAKGEQPRRSLENSERFLTSIGAQLGQYSDSLRYRLSEAVWQAKEARNSAPEVLKDRLREEKSQPAKDQITVSADEIVFREVLDWIQAKFRCSAAAIVFAPATPKGIVKIQCRGRGGERLAQYLQHLADELESKGLRTFRDGDVESRLFSPELAGFREGLIFPFHVTRAGQPDLGLLWLGYGDAQPATVIEQDWAREIARIIERELLARRALTELSSKLQEMEQASRQKSDLIAQMSHDLKSPVHNIQAVLQMLRELGQSAKSEEMIELGLRSCQSLSDLVEDLLEYSRFQAGRLRANRASAGLGLLVQQMCAEFVVLANKRGLDLRLSVEESVQPVLVDPRHLKRIIANLVSNAIKYTKHGHVEVLVKSKGDSTALVVEDSGVGMNADQLSRLFRPFTRFHDESIEGVGLGLAICKILVEENGGIIEVTSREGAGTKFTVTFPCANTDCLQSAAASIKEFKTELKPAITPTVVPSRSYVVLIVDDDLDYGATLAQALKYLGYEALSVSSVVDAVSVINFGTPSIVISDANMPDGGADRLLELIQMCELSLPVIVTTGEDSSELRNRLLAAGALDVLVKPVENDKLLLAIDRALSSSDSAERLKDVA